MDHPLFCADTIRGVLPLLVGLLRCNTELLQLIILIWVEVACTYFILDMVNRRMSVHIFTRYVSILGASTESLDWGEAHQSQYQLCVPVDDICRIPSISSAVDSSHNGELTLSTDVGHPYILATYKVQGFLGILRFRDQGSVFVSRS
jgi:hypothetical protein